MIIVINLQVLKVKNNIDNLKSLPLATKWVNISYSIFVTPQIKLLHEIGIQMPLERMAMIKYFYPSILFLGRGCCPARDGTEESANKPLSLVPHHPPMYLPSRSLQPLEA